MKSLGLCILAATLGATAASALEPDANGNPLKTGPSPTSGSDAGPFPPSISNGAPRGLTANSQPAAPANAQPAVVPAITPARQRAIEQEMDRAEREAEKARASQPVNALNPGGYDGTTSEKNR